MRFSFVQRVNISLSNHPAHIKKVILNRHLKAPVENLELLEVIKRLNGLPLGSISDNSNLLKKLILSENCSQTKQLRDFSRRAISIVLQDLPDMNALLLIMKTYLELMRQNPDASSYHYELLTAIEKRATDILKNNLDEQTIKNSLRLSVSFFLVSPPHAKFFRQLVINSLVHFCKDVSRSDYAMFIFLIILNRSPMSKKVSSWVESQFLRLFESLTIDEICLVSVAYHKTNTAFMSKIIQEKVIDKIIKNVTQIKSRILLSCLIKGLTHMNFDPRYSLFVAIYKFMNNWPAAIHNYVHLLDFGVTKKCYQPEVIDRALKALTENYDDFRHKDVERVIKAATQFEHDLPQFQKIREIVKLIEKDENFLKRTESIANLARSLCFLDINSEKIFKKICEYKWKNFLDLRDHQSIIDSGAINLMIIRDYLSIIKHLNHNNNLKNLDEVFEILLKNPKIRPTPIDFFSGRWANRLQDKIYVANIASISEAARTSFSDYKLWLGHIISSSTKIEMILYKTENQKNILLSSKTAKPSSLAGCILLQVVTKNQFAFRDCTKFSAYARFRNQLFSCLEIDVISLPFWEMTHNSQDEVVYYLTCKRRDYEKQMKKS